MKNRDYSLEDVFDLENQKPLIVPKHTANIELSINLPPTKKYMQLEDKYKKQCYLNLMTYLKLHLPFEFNNIDFEFEGGDKKLHYHSSWEIKIAGQYSVEGVVMDIVRIIKSQMIYSHKRINDSNYSHRFQRFKDNLLCVQYKEKPRSEWEEYIKKTRPK